MSDDLVAPLTKDIIQYIKLLLGVFTDFIKNKMSLKSYIYINGSVIKRDL